MDIFDFRSDTVTKPTLAMREAMAKAEVGDDVYGDDPSVNELQAYAAELLGMEAALYACSGTMGNLLALLSLCARGEGVMMGINSHTWKNEGGGIALYGGLMPYPLDDASGIPSIESMHKFFQPEGNVHYAPTKLLALENTHNMAGGVPISPAVFSPVAHEAHRMGMKVHLDGARIFDACAYCDVDVKEYTSQVDSIQVCLSKGLGAPMGSLLCGRKEMIETAKKYRKSLGGGQRQVGIAAAAGLVALRDMRGRLKEDHANAALLADLLQQAGIDVESVPARTNMVYFTLRQGQPSAETVIARCGEKGLLLGAAAERRLRMVTHVGLDERTVRDAVEIVKGAILG